MACLRDGSTSRVIVHNEDFGLISWKMGEHVEVWVVQGGRTEIELNESGLSGSMAGMDRIACEKMQRDGQPGSHHQLGALLNN